MPDSPTLLPDAEEDAPAMADKRPPNDPQSHTAAESKSDGNTQPAAGGGHEWDFLAPPKEADEIGRLGAYRVLKVLGSGGMGVVFKAEDPQLKRMVALKAMRPALAASASAGERFIREARATAAIKHDNIVTIHQVDQDRGVPFIAMEFLEGEPLEDRLGRDGKLTIPEAIRVGKEIARGLAAAHKRDLIHRDIKPANIWLEAETGRVKIVDFGLARAAGQESNLTQQGAIIGTPAYMAPEQASGNPVDHKVDLFSLGCVLYLACTGQRPFKGNDTVSTLVAVATETPPAPRQISKQVPKGLSDLIMRLLEKKPGNRPASAQTVVDALHDVETGPTIPDPPLRATVTLPLPSKKRLEPAQPIADRAPINRPTRKTKKRAESGLPWVWLGAGGTVVVVTVIVTLVVVFGGHDKPPQELKKSIVVQAKGENTKIDDVAKELPPSDKAGIDKPAIDKAVIDKTVIDKPVIEKPTDVRPPDPPPEKSPKKGEKILFDGVDLSGWVAMKGEAPNWKVANGYVEAGQGDIRTKSKVGPDFQLHVEFWVPPDSKGKKGKVAGDSGVFIQNRYKIQIADSYGVQKPTEADCGALFNRIAPGLNACKPAGGWQSFEITFHGPRIHSNGKLTNGRLTVIHNGVTIINNAPVDPMPEKKHVDAASIRLQGVGHPVRFRNIRLVELPAPVLSPLPEKSLFDGKSMTGWINKNDGMPASWKVSDGAMVMGAGDIYTKEKFGPHFQLHVEFLCGAAGKAGKPPPPNSGVYLHGRYEIQIFNSYGKKTLDANDCGALWGQIVPSTNACKPPGEWQSFDITFRAPKVGPKGGILQPGRLTVVHNGVTVIDDQTFDRVGAQGLDSDMSQPGPILLQAHGGIVRFRNIRLTELPP
ncbi:MAG: DUF1080 domain-containing protein [Planctomycetes bacterium]|nr:DUF1080 domain-containing protein [Planctomycetota bacterium]